MKVKTLKKGNTKLRCQLQFSKKVKQVKLPPTKLKAAISGVRNEKLSNQLSKKDLATNKSKLTRNTSTQISKCRAVAKIPNSTSQSAHPLQKTSNLMFKSSSRAKNVTSIIIYNEV